MYKAHLWVPWDHTAELGDVPDLEGLSFLRWNRRKQCRWDMTSMITAKPEAADQIEASGICIRGTGQYRTKSFRAGLQSRSGTIRSLIYVPIQLLCSGHYSKWLG